jgi:hypothetical protein
MRALKLANVRVINLLAGAMAINCWEKPAGVFDRMNRIIRTVPLAVQPILILGGSIAH